MKSEKYYIKFAASDDKIKKFKLVLVLNEKDVLCLEKDHVTE